MSLRTAEAARRGPDSGSAPPKQRPSKRPVLIAAAVALAVLILVLVSRGGGTDKSKVSANKSPNTTSGQADAGVAPPSIEGGATGANGAGGAAGAGAANDAAARAARAAEEQAKRIPLNVSVSNTQGLKDGDAVKIHVTPKPGAVVFGFEAFLCKGGSTTYAFDADIRPDDTGKCVAHKLSPNSDDYMEVRAQPPYSSADASFRVGVGTDTFEMTDGSQGRVTCGPSNPCAIVLKLQYPNGFGFEAIPVTYR
jgi:hypothetical protein